MSSSEGLLVADADADRGESAAVVSTSRFIPFLVSFILPLPSKGTHDKVGEGGASCNLMNLWGDRGGRIPAELFLVKSVSIGLLGRPPSSSLPCRM